MRLTETAQNAAMRAARVASRLVDPHGGPGERELRKAASGKVVMVTGASHGIGEAAVRQLGAAGATVLLIARSADRLEQICGEIAAAGGSAFAYPTDLSDSEQVDAMVAQVLERHGHVDVIVNNAGKSIRRSLELSYDRFHDFERTMGINYLGPVKLLLALLPSMRERGSGQVINLSTAGVRGLPPAPRWAAYQSSKGAFDIFMRSAAPELRVDGIATTSIYMTLVHTRMSAPTPIWRYVPGLTPEEAAELICRAIVKRPRVIAPWWGRPAQLATLALDRPLEAALSLVYRATSDSASARGDSAAPAARAASPALRVLRAPIAPARLAATALRAGAASGLLSPVRPDRLVRMAGALRQSAGLAGLAAVNAARHPNRPAIIDERGSITFGELQRRSAAIAAGLHAELGVGPERGLAVMCRNHRGFVEAALAGARLGADLVLLNTEFSGPQLAQTLAHYELGAVVHDEEFAERFKDADLAVPRVLTGTEAGSGATTLDALAEHAGSAPRTRRAGRVVLLTSGTTGAPKGAPRSPSPLALAGPAISVLSLIGLRSGEPVVVCTPFFHGFGIAGLVTGLALGSPVVCERRFDAERTLALIDEHRASAMFAVPVMLQRIMRLPEQVRAGYDTATLRTVLSGAAPLSPALAGEFMDAFGEVLYNGYGSTETGIGAIASPADLREAPGTVGRAPHGTAIRILGPHDHELPVGESGRIFLASDQLFEGYTGGGSKDMAGNAMSTGDLGHLDAEGRLFIDGREDDMIVSGGENVFPGEVEDTLADHPAVADVAVIGVADEEFGQRLAAYVVAKPDTEVSVDELKAHVKAQLARYKVPRDVVFCDELPRNPTGKLLRTKLHEVSA